MRRWAIVGLLVAAGLAAWSFGGLRPAKAACPYIAATNSNFTTTTVCGGTLVYSMQ